MGNQTSSTISAATTASTSSAEDIFTTNYQEIPFSNKFISDLLTKDPEKVVKALNFPEASFITDIITESTTFTSESSADKVCSDVLVPLFKGGQDTKPYHQQIILQYIRFLKDRVNSGFSFEQNRRQQLQERNSRNRGEVVRRHAYPEDEGQYTEEIEASLSEILNIVCSKKISQYVIKPVKGNNFLAKAAIKGFNNVNSTQGLLDLTVIGFRTSELSPIIYALQKSIERTLEGDKTKFHTSKFEPIISGLDKIDLMNSCFIPTFEGLLASVPVSKFNRSTYDPGFIATTGNAIYLASPSEYILRISLDKDISPTKERMAKFSTNKPADSIACSNGYMLVFEHGGGVVVKKNDSSDQWVAPKTKAFDPAIEMPVISDGIYIYSILKKKVNIFTLNKTELIFIRSVPLSPPKTQTDVFNSEYKPFYYTNGVSLSMMVFEINVNGRWKYTTRHYSLIDGAHLGDVQVYIQFPLVALQYDSSNDCIWGISRVSQGINILKYPMDSAKPPWLTGLKPEEIVSSEDIVKEAKKIASPHSLSILIDDFLGYTSAYLSGSKFAACNNNPSYNLDFARFFGPTTPEFIDLLLSTIEFIVKCIKQNKEERKWTKSRFLNTLSTLLRILDYNLSNFETRLTGSDVIQLNDTYKLLDILFTLYTSPEFESIKSTVAFTIMNNFDLLTKDDKGFGCELFERVYLSASSRTKQWITNTAIKSETFAYYINSKTARPIFAPILKAMVTPNAHVSRTQKAFLEAYMGAIVYDFKVILEEYPADIPGDKLQIQDTFQAFSSLFVENAMVYYNNKAKAPVFYDIFSKWLMLLKPFTRFSRTSAMIVSILQPLFTIALQFITTADKKDKDMDRQRGAFLELYALFADFISSLIHGGDELSEITDYSWLIFATEKTNISPEFIDKIAPACFEGDQEAINLLRNNLEFPDTEESKKMGIDKTQFFIDTLNKEEQPDTKLVMDYLYKKVNNPMNRKLTPEERHLERVTLLVFVKQLNIYDLIIALFNDLKNSKTPPINSKLKKIMNLIYRIRRTFRQSKQATNALKVQAEENMIPFEPKKLEENYPVFIEKYLKKCVFLIQIGTTHANIQEESEKEFTRMSKNIDSFISTTTTLEDFYKVLAAAKKSKDNVSTGLCLVCDIIEKNVYPLCTSNLVEKFAATNSFDTYLKSLGDSSNTAAIVSTQGFSNIQRLLDNIKDLFLSKKGDIQQNTLIVFYINLLTSISAVTPEIMLETVKQLTIEIIERRKQFQSMRLYDSIMTFIVANVYTFLEKNPEWKHSKQVEDLLKILLPSGFTKECNLSIAILCRKNGMKIDVSIKTLIDMFHTDNPDKYHSLTSFLSDILLKDESRNKILSNIFRTIASIANGTPEFFLKKFPLLHDSKQFSSNVVRTSGILLSGCSELIQMIRHYLSNNDEMSKYVSDIIKYILARSSGVPELVEESKEKDEEFKLFKDSSFLYAVFAILSNVIETTRKFSLIKDTLTNTIYYVSAFNSVNNFYWAWKLPITSNSRMVCVPLGANIIPLSSLPFSITQFCDYRYLMPYFTRALRGSNSYDSYSSIGLNFYILSSLHEYVGNVEFLKKFIDYYGIFNLSKITYTSSVQSFRRIIKHHLNNGGSGFNSEITDSTIFQYISPADIVHPSKYSITKSKVSCQEGIHAFITSTLSLLGPTYFTFNITNNTKCVRVGLISITCEEGEGESLLFESENGKSKILAKGTTFISLEDSSKFIIQYDPMKGIATIYGNDMVPLHSMMFPTKQVSCWAQFFGAGELEYSISSERPRIRRNDNVQETKTMLAPRSIRQSVFRRKCPFVTKESNEPIEELIRKSENNVKTEFVYTKGSLTKEVREMNLRIFNSSADKNPYPALIRYPPELLEDAATKLSIAENIKAVIEENPQLQPLAFKISDNSRTTSTYGGTLLSTIQPDSVIDTICDIRDAAVIDDTSGIRNAGESVKNVFVKYSELAFVSPMYWGVLPADLLNFYASGYTSHARLECTNEIFLTFINQPNADFDYIMKHFNYTFKDLVNQFLSLLLYNEKLSPKEIIDYKVNYLNPDTPPKDASLHLYKNVMNKILAYVNSHDLVEQFAEIWMNEVTKRFNNGHYHTIIDGHPSALVFTSENLKEDIKLYRPDINLWFVLKGSFKFNGERSGTIFHDDVYTAVTNKVIIVKGDSLTVCRADPGDKGNIVVIPVSKFSNESLLGTFVDLTISFKYLARYIAENDAKISQSKSQIWRTELYTLLIDSILAHSPYFNSYGISIIQYLEKILPMLSSDINGRLLQRLNFVARFAKPSNTSPLGRWLQEKQNLWDERVILPLKSYFRDFLTQADIKEVEDLKDAEFHVPQKLPWNISTNDDIGALFTDIKRLLMKRDTLAGYPFYLLMHYWAAAQMRLPPCETKIVDKNTLRITFTPIPSEDPNIKNELVIPNKFFIAFNGKQYKGKFYSTIKYGSNKKLTTDKEVLTYGHQQFFITIDDEWDKYQYSVESSENYDIDQFMFKNKDLYASHLKQLLLRWDRRTDTSILSCFQSSEYTGKTLDLNFNPCKLNTKRLAGYPLSLLYVRACCLLTLNWIIFNKLVENESISEFTYLISPAIKMKSFNDKVQSGPSTSIMPSLQVDRKAAVDVRSGISTNLSNTIIAQISNRYSASSYRVKGDRPWTVSFVGEHGIDVGGPARELITEAAIDLMSPSCGLVIPTPNAKNNIGANRDSFVPYPNQDHRNIEKQYNFAGGLIAMCIRSGLVQEFTFPPCVWDFFVSGELTIDDIFGIDQNYKILIESIKEALNSCMTEEEFAQQYDIKFVVYGIAGEEHSLTPRGRTERVTLANAERFIALANEFRINELTRYLTYMRNGIWDNLGFEVPMSLDGQTLEFAACGDKDISYEALRDIINFVGISEDQQAIFLRVIEEFTPEQRSALLKFATARVRLPPAGSSNQFQFKVDNNGGLIDMLPTSSTCFHALHLPRYTSFTNAFNMISVAIEFTGTFENA